MNRENKRLLFLSADEKKICRKMTKSGDKDRFICYWLYHLLEFLDLGGYTNDRCTGHSACDAILADNGRVDAQPALNAANADAELIHEAAIGKIAGEQILKLCSRGLTKEEAEEKIIEGFLK